MDCTLDFDYYSLGGAFNNKANKFCNDYKNTFLGVSKLSKFKIFTLSEIVVRGKNPYFLVICQKLTMLEQLTDQLLVESN